MTMTQNTEAQATTTDEQADEQLYRVAQMYMPPLGEARERRSLVVPENRVAKLRETWRRQIRTAGGEWGSDWVTAHEA